MGCLCPHACEQLGWKLTGPKQGESNSPLSSCTWKLQGDIPLTPGSLAWIEQMALPLLPPVCGCWVKHGSPDLISGFTLVHIFSLTCFNERTPVSECRTTIPSGVNHGSGEYRRESLLCCQPSPEERHQLAQKWEDNWRCRHLASYPTGHLVDFISVFNKTIPKPPAS